MPRRPEGPGSRPTMCSPAGSLIANEGHYLHRLPSNVPMTERGERTGWGRGRRVRGGHRLHLRPGPQPWRLFGEVHEGSDQGHRCLGTVVTNGSEVPLLGDRAKSCWGGSPQDPAGPPAGGWQRLQNQAGGVPGTSGHHLVVCWPCCPGAFCPGTARTPGSQHLQEAEPPARREEGTTSFLSWLPSPVHVRASPHRPHHSGAAGPSRLWGLRAGVAPGAGVSP